MNFGSENQIFDKFKNLVILIRLFSEKFGNRAELELLQSCKSPKREHLKKSVGIVTTAVKQRN